MKNIHAFIFGALVAFAFSCQIMAKPLSPQDLFSDDKITQFSLSPTGEYIAYVSPQGMTDLITIVEVDGMKKTYSSHTNIDRLIGQIIWVKDHRLLLWYAQRTGLHKTNTITDKIIAMNYDGKYKAEFWGSFISPY